MRNNLIFPPILYMTLFYLLINELILKIKIFGMRTRKTLYIFPLGFSSGFKK